MIFRTKTVEALTGNDSQLIKCSSSRRRNQFKSVSIRSFHSCAVFQASDHTLSPSAGEIDPFEDYDSDNIDRPGGKNFKNTNHRNDQKQESVRISRPIQNVRSENENIDQFDEYRYPQNSKYQQTDDFQESPKKSRFREQYQNYDDDFQYRTSRRSNYTRFPDREHQHGGYRRRSFRERDPEEFIPKTDFGEEELFDESNSGINFDKYDDIPVEVSGSNCPNHINSFDELMVEDRLKRNMARSKYGKPTPVQKYAFPIALAQRDLMSCAQTGSGKTAAFLIPLLNHILNERQNEEKVNPSLSPSGLIIAPTRELCSQLYKEAVRFAYRTGIRACAVYGGASIGVQMRNIEKGCDLLVATPGRLNDLLDRGAVQLERCKYLVLDEADRMLDMGFEPQIRKVVEDYDMPKPGERQTLMFSATFPEEIQEMARDFLNDYLFLAVGRVGSTSENITQNLLYVDQGEKVSRLIDLLEAEEPTARKLVFVSMKRTADYIEARLRGRNLLASSIHGDKSQRKREDALFKFKSGITPTLVATSVAARGLDIPNVTHVINYDLPNDIDEYVHRIGRTGRVGNTGNATSFFTNEDAQLATDLKEILKETKHEVPMWLEELSTRRYRGKKGAFKNRNVPRFGGTDYRKRNQNFSKYGGGGDHRNQFGNLHRRRTDDFTDRSLYGIEEEDEINTMKS